MKTADKMRTPAEIRRAIESLRPALDLAIEKKDQKLGLNLVVILQVLEWTLGSNEPGGFGDMMNDVLRVDKAGSN